MRRPKRLPFSCRAAPYSQTLIRPLRRLSRRRCARMPCAASRTFGRRTRLIASAALPRSIRREPPPPTKQSVHLFGRINRGSAPWRRLPNRGRDLRKPGHRSALRRLPTQSGTLRPWPISPWHIRSRPHYPCKWPDRRSGCRIRPGARRVPRNGRRRSRRGGPNVVVRALSQPPDPNDRLKHGHDRRHAVALRNAGMMPGRHR